LLVLDSVEVDVAVSVLAGAVLLSLESALEDFVSPLVAAGFGSASVGLFAR